MLIASGAAMQGASNAYTRKVVVAVAAATFAFLLVAALYMASHVLLLIFGGVLLATLLRGLGDLVSQYTRIPPGWSVLLVGGVLVLVFGWGGWYLSAEIAGQFDELGRNMAAMWQQVRGLLGKYSWGRDLLTSLGEYQLDSGNVGAIGKVIGATLGGVSGLVLSVIIGVYVAADPGLYFNGVLRLVPLGYRPRAEEILRELSGALRRWLMGTLLLMTFVGTLITIGLYLLGIPLALALGLIMFVLEFIPYLGPILAALPAVLIASTLGPQEVLWVVLLYWGVQSLEGYVLSPLVFQRSVDIPPLVTMSAQVVLGTMLGVLGIVFATPLAACALVLVNRVYIEDVLGDRRKQREA
ncbi:MAG TPA: AI-2E family transporter [Burkholderiales bacterium]|nr:AI-2E family transporter [Burkholderiales bacterium]